MRVKLEDWAYMPERAHETDAGADLKTPFAVTVRAKDSVIIDTGVHIELPPNTVGMLKSKEQIEEFKSDLDTMIGNSSQLKAEKLYEKGWRKQSVGEWVYKFSIDGDKFYECSVCGRQEVVNCLCKVGNLAEDIPYCHCGARMSGGKNEQREAD